MRRWFAAVAAASAAVLLAVPALPASAGGVSISTVTTGLDSPRGLAFLPNGTLVVSEAGHGGDVCLGSSGPCVGATSQVSTINLAAGTHTPVATGMFSLFDPEGGALGVDDLAVQGGRLLGIVGFFPQAFAGADCTAPGMPSDCAQVLAAAQSQAGALIKFTPSGAFKVVANPGKVDYQYTADNPGGDIYGHETDSNPYGLFALPRGTYVADAGANTLDWVANNGKVSIVQRFVVPDPAEPFPTDAVPTCVAPSGHSLIVADLAGRIWRVTGSSADQIAGPTGTSYTGGPHYTGCAADHAGNVYVVSMFSGLFPNPGTGSLMKVSPDGTVSPVTGTDALFFPNKIAVGHDGALYVTTGSVCTNVVDPNPCGGLTGSVIKITL